MIKLSQAQYDIEQAKIEGFRKDLKASWHTLLADNMANELEANGLLDWQKAHLLERMRAGENEQRKVIEELLAKLDAMADELCVDTNI